MALKTKETERGEQPLRAEADPSVSKPASSSVRNGAADSDREARGPRTNAEVEKRLNPYIEANRNDFERYTKLVKENPDRAVRTLMLKDMTAREGEMRLIEKQIPAARDWYNRQTPEVKQGIDERVAKVAPFNRDQAFVTAVVRERNWQNRLPLAPSRQGMSVG